MRAFTAMWDRICRDRYEVSDPSQRRFRYGVQVNSLGLTEQQPENNVQRIVLELLGVTLSADARARAVQLPAWNEAIGLPRQADQQWSLRIQQVLAYETDLLEYPDLFAGSLVMEAKTDELDRRRPGRARRRPRPRRRVRRDRRAEGSRSSRARPRGSPPSSRAPSASSGSTASPTPRARRSASTRAVGAHRRPRRRGRRSSPTSTRGARRATQRAVTAALDELRRVAEGTGDEDNVMVPTIALALAGGTTGEWAGALREVFGEYRAPTGVDRRAGRPRVAGRRRRARAGALEARPATAARGQARARRALERRRADRRRGARRGVRGRLPGDPAHERGDRRRRPATRTSTWSGCRCSRARHLAVVPEVLAELREAGVTAAVVVGGHRPGRRRRAR